MNYNRLQSDTVTVTDLYLTAYLKIAGCPILEVDRSNSRKVQFIFPVTAKDKILQFHNGGKVDSCRYASAIEEVKSLIFDIR